MSIVPLKPFGGAGAVRAYVRRSVATVALALAMTAPLALPAAAARTHATVNTQQAPVYKDASGSGEPVAQLLRGEEVSVDDWTDDGYCQVNIGSEKGYIKSSQLKKFNVSEKYSPSKRGRINADGVNLRTRFDLDASIISVMKKGTQVEVLGRFDNWFKVNLNGTIGYINVDYIDIDSGSEGAITVLRMGMSGKEVARMQQALADRGYYKGEINGNFGARSRDALKAFQHDQRLLEDGVAGPETLDRLYAD